MMMMPPPPGLLLCRAVQTTAAVALAGTAVLRLLARGTGLAPLRAWDRLALGSGAVLAAASALQLVLTAAAMSGLPPVQAVSAGVLGSVLGGTSYGAAWRVRAVLLAGALVWWRLTVTGPRQVPVPARVATVLPVVGVGLSGALLASLVWPGHAHASASRAWLLPVNLAHAVAAGAWPGGLLPLAWLLARTRDDPRLVPAAWTITRRFSRLSVAAVLVLALSGGLNACGLLGVSLSAWSSPYGRLALGKAALFAVMLLLGAANRRRLGSKTMPGDARLVRRLWRFVAWECALAVLVLLASAALATSAPPDPLPAD